MTTPTYRLPDSLGGAPCEIVTQDVDRQDRVRVWVKTGEDVGDYIELHRRLLVEVEPTLPPEPPVGRCVGIEMVEAEPTYGVVFRRYEPGWAAPGDESGEHLTWAEVYSYGSTPPVLLVPDPAAGAATSGEWRCLNYKNDAFEVELVEGESRVEVRTNGWVYLSADDAESAAAVLLAAARAARAS